MGKLVKSSRFIRALLREQKYCKHPQEIKWFNEQYIPSMKYFADKNNTDIRHEKSPMILLFMRSRRGKEQRTRLICKCVMYIAYKH